MSAKVNTEIAVDIAYHIKEMLNNEIRKTGEIGINNKVIWNGYLHQMGNEDWRGILETWDTFKTQHPRYFKQSHCDAIDDGLALMDKFEPYYDRVMDMKNRHVQAKFLAWKCIMTIRETWNDAVGEYLPNLDESKVKTSYDQLFGE